MNGFKDDLQVRFGRHWLRGWVSPPGLALTLPGPGMPSLCTAESCPALGTQAKPPLCRKLGLYRPIRRPEQSGGPSPAALQPQVGTLAPLLTELLTWGPWLHLR